MEASAATTLRNYLRTRSPGLDERLLLCVRAADCLIDLHRHDALHGEISPDLLHVDPDTGRVELRGPAESVPPEDAHAATPEEEAVPALAYISPEQTGRLNRAVDHRSDFYSLGVTLYEILVGTPPFQSLDALELVHSHIARAPVPPHQVEPTVPETLSRIVLRLLAKSPDDRYRSARGLKHDLEECHRRYEEAGRIDAFPLGLQDVSATFHLPRKLYGRDREIEGLRAAFDRSLSGGRVALMVTGPPGVGKSSLVEEIRAYVSNGRHATLLQGKFDQLVRDVAYDAFGQAFRELVRGLLSERDEVLQSWRERMLNAWGANGKLLTEMVPDLKLIVGEQPELAPLDPSESRSRHSEVLRGFVKLFIAPERPLVLFLDDLQWADPASLSLLELLLTDADLAHLLVIGAYRNTEVDASHPLTATLERLLAAGTDLEEIAIGPLPAERLGEMIQDAVPSTPDKVRTLAEVLHRSANGNPFFSRRFLMTLSQEGLLRYSPEDGMWDWNTEELTQVQISRDPEGFVVGLLEKLSAPAVEVLKHGACIGDRFRPDSLATLMQRLPEDLADPLAEAVQAHILSAELPETPPGPIDTTTDATAFSFQHDRLREAAYSLLAEEQRSRIHLQLGRERLAGASEEAVDEALFDIVWHLNEGRSRLSGREERCELARLNLQAANKAKAAAAFETSLSYLRRAAELLDEEAWRTHHALCWQVYHEKADREFTCALLDECEQTLNVALGNSVEASERVSLNQIHLRVLFQRNRHYEAIREIRDVLGLLGVPLPRKAGKLHVAYQFARFHLRLGRRRPSDLLDLPEMTDPRSLQICAVIYDAVPSTYMVDPLLMSYLSMIMANTCLRHGNSVFAPFAYAMISCVMTSLTKQYGRAYALADMAIRLNETHPNLDVKARIHFLAGFFLVHWVRPIREHRAWWETAFEATRLTGNLHWHNYCVTFTRPQRILFNPEGLEDIEAENKAHYDLHVSSRDEEVILNQRYLLDFIRWLRGRAGEPDPDLPPLDGEAYARTMAEPGNLILRMYFHVFGLVRAYLMGDYATALGSARNGYRLVGEVLGNLSDHVLRFYYLLTVIALRDTLGPLDRLRTALPYRVNRFMLRLAARSCPENYRAQEQLVRAEEARVRQNTVRAIARYERAIDAARQSGFPLLSALCHERAGTFFLQQGWTRVGSVFLAEAHARYAAWGAHAKTRQLEATHPGLVPAPRTGRPGQEEPAPDSALDLRSVLKASRVISSEINLDRLVGTLVRIAIENAGAQLGFLLLPADGTLWIEAGGTADEPEVAVRRRVPMEATDQLSEAMVRFVARTGKPLVLHDASREGPFTEDPHVRRRRSRSVLCMPLHHQGELAGILYLENRLIVGAFTENRIEVLRILLSQAAVSLRNASLYEHLRSSEARFRSLVENAPDTILTAAPDGMIRFVNRSLPWMPHDRAVGSNILDLVTPEHRERVRESMERVMTTGGTDAYEALLPLEDGRSLCIDFRVGPVRIEEEITALTFIATDVSERKRAEEEKATLEAQLRRSQRMEAIGTLAGGIAHDFNNILTAIMGYAELASFEASSDTQLGSNLEQVVRAGNRARDLVKQILTFSRQTERERAPVRVGPVVVEALKLIEASLPATIDVRWSVRAEADTILADLGQVHQVLMNLCTNAAHAMREQGGVLEVILEEADIEPGQAARYPGVAPGGYLRLSVRDTGHGIERAIQDRIFDPFFTTKGVGEGTGMGLSVVHGIVKSHNGLVTVRSEPDRGTVFEVLLPRFEGEAPVAPAATDALPTGHARILFVDDEVAIVDLQRQILERLGYRVEATTSSTEALDLFRASPDGFDLVITDMTMPALTGVDLCREMLRLRPDLPIILCTGFSEAVAPETAREMGVRTFLMKPVLSSELARAVSETLGGE